MPHSLKPWQMLDEQIVFARPPYLEISKQIVQLPDGMVIDDFYQVYLRPFVIVVPLLADGTILTLKQYKHGAGRVSLTFPAGFVEDGEGLQEACRRELLEETGYHADALIHLGEFVDNGNQRGCNGNYYVATDCVKVKEPVSDDLEEMHLERLAASDVDEALKHGEFAIIHHASAWSIARLLGFIEV